MGDSYDVTVEPGLLVQLSGGLDDRRSRLIETHSEPDKNTDTGIINITVLLITKQRDG